MPHEVNPKDSAVFGYIQPRTKRARMIEVIRYERASHFEVRAAFSYPHQALAYAIAEGIAPDPYVYLRVAGDPAHTLLGGLDHVTSHQARAWANAE